MILFDFLLIFIIKFFENKNKYKQNQKKMKTKKLSKKVFSPISLGMWIVIMLFMMTSVTTTKANNVHLYLDSVQTWSKNYFCKTTVDTVILHKPSQETLQQWVWGGNGFTTDTVLIPNTIIGNNITCYCMNGSKTIYVGFAEPILTSPLLDQTVCGISPISLSVGTEQYFTNYLWNTGDTTATISTNVTGTHTIVVSNACGIAYDTCQLVFVHLDGEGCAATFDQTTQKNKILWDGTNLQGEQQIILKRALNNVLSPVDTVAFSSGEWIDFDSNPQSEESGYAVRPIDTCHNMGNISTEMVTIWLSISEYQGDTYFTYTLGAPEQPTYQLNGIKATGEVDSLTSRPASFNNILLPSTIAEQYIKFYISYAIHCGNSKGLIQVKSNTVAGITGITESQNNKVSVYPNPVSSNLTIYTDNIEQVDIQLIDILGNILYRGNQATIDMTTYSSGMYTLRILTPKGGLYSQKIIKK